MWEREKLVVISRFPTVFLKDLFCKHVKTIDFSGFDDVFLYGCLDVSFSSTFYHTIPTFNDPEKEAFRKHCGKRRKCW